MAKRVRELLGALEVDALEQFLEEARRGGDVDEITQLIAAFNSEREVALRSLRDLKIQREALGFVRHEDLARLYPVPGEKKVTGPG